jgi:MtN3 and saliva related transmembrane protein
MFFDELSLGILATAAGVTILAGWIPQILKGYRTKKLEDVSKFLVVLIAIGAFLWFIYGVEKNDPYIIGVNVVAIGLTMTVLVMKMKYEKKLRNN